jgi:hypothetical protein
MADCPHLFTDEAKRCLECNELIEKPMYTYQEFITELGKTFGNQFIVLPSQRATSYVEIAKIIQNTLKQYHEVVVDNQDPNNPLLPKLRIIGDQILRIPFTMIWNNLVADSYIQALQSGYKSSFIRWKQILDEARTIPDLPQNT